MVDDDPISYELSQVWQEVRNDARRHVVGGYRSQEEITELAAEFAAELGYERDLRVTLIESVAASVVAELMAEQQDQERTWIAPTDCDRLNSAFERLEQSGIIDRQHFGATQKDGFDRMLYEELPKVSNTVRGFTFFNEQSAEAAMDYGALTLSYGAADMDPERSVLIANEVVRTLIAMGLQAKWAGTLRERILVDSLDWKRRRFAAY